MRKAALQLLVAMLMYNPFGGELPLELFANSLQEYSDKLKVPLCCLPVSCCCESPAVRHCERSRTGVTHTRWNSLLLHPSKGASAYVKLIDLASPQKTAVLLAGACPTGA